MYFVDFLRDHHILISKLSWSCSRHNLPLEPLCQKINANQLKIERGEKIHLVIIIHIFIDSKYLHAHKGSLWSKREKHSDLEICYVPQPWKSHWVCYRISSAWSKKSPVRQTTKTGTTVRKSFYVNFPARAGPGWSGMNLCYSMFTINLFWTTAPTVSSSTSLSR